MKIYITYDLTSKRLKSVQTHYDATTGPDLPTLAGTGSAVVLTENIPEEHYGKFLRNFDSFKYNDITSMLELEGGINARYISLVARDTSIPMALGRAATIGDFGSL